MPSSFVTYLDRAMSLRDRLIEFGRRHGSSSGSAPQLNHMVHVAAAQARITLDFLEIGIHDYEDARADYVAASDNVARVVSAADSGELDVDGSALVDEARRAQLLLQ